MIDSASASSANSADNHPFQPSQVQSGYKTNGSRQSFSPVWAGLIGNGETGIIGWRRSDYSPIRVQYLGYNPRQVRVWLD